jgi:hypothetical protein
MKNNRWKHEAIPPVGESVNGQAEPKKKPSLPEIEDAFALMAEDLPEPPDVVVNILHQGSKCSLGGGSKSFKTWTLTYLGLSVAMGEPFMGFPTVKGKVLYINLEIQRGFFRKRLLSISKAMAVSIPVDGLHVWNLRGHAADLSEMMPLILERLKATAYTLIIIDPIYKVLGRRDENAAGDIAGLLNEIEKLAVQSGAAVAFGAHFSKGNQAGKEAIDRVGGSGVFARDPDTILTLTKHEQENAFTVEATLRNHAPVEPFVVRWQFPLMVPDADLDPTKLKQVKGRPKLHTEDDLRDILGKDELTMSEWEQLAADPEHGKMGVATFYRLAKTLKKSGRVKQSALNQKWYAA